MLSTNPQQSPDLNRQAPYPLAALDDAALFARAQHLRRQVIRMLTRAGSGHPGGSLGTADLLAVLFYATMRHDPADPNWAGRDRFVLSNGHVAPILYAILADTGYFPEAWLDRLRQLNAPLQGHPSKKTTPGVEISTGSLGQGFAAAQGMALAQRLDGHPGRVYVMLGDGEIEEGGVWETAMSAAHFGLARLTAIVDANGQQIDGPCAEVIDPQPIGAKFAAFGWQVTEIDGHDFAAIRAALANAREETSRPSAIVARTVMGRGVSFMEGNYRWHGKVPSAEQAEQALRELASQPSAESQ